MLRREGEEVEVGLGQQHFLFCSGSCDTYNLTWMPSESGPCDKSIYAYNLFGDMVPGAGKR